MKNSILIALISCITFSLNAQQKTISKGEWDSDSFFIEFEGTWKIIKEGEKTYLVINDDFETKKAPDLKIYLSKLDLDDISAKNAADKTSSVFVSLLTKYEGGSKHLLPKGINLKDYKTVLVHCVEYNRFWGGSSLW